MQNVIEVNSLSFGYNADPIFTHVDLNVNRGNFIAVIGANGAGKSTLLKLILGELIPNNGEIKLFGQDVRRFKDWPKVGYIPQAGLGFGVNFPATAEEVVKANLFPQIGLMRFPNKEHKEKTRKALKLVGMEEYGHRLIGELSGGQLQKVLLARVLVNEPVIMLLDEPTAGIDSRSVLSLYKLLSDLNKKMNLTIIMVTHDIARASEYVSRTLCLEYGSLVELGKAQIENELSHKHRHPVRKGDY